MTNDDFEITDAARAAWQSLNERRAVYPKLAGLDSFIVADFARDCLARALRAEFNLEHRQWMNNPYCMVCGKWGGPEADHRHGYDWPQWLELAEKELEGK